MQDSKLPNMAKNQNDKIINVWYIYPPFKSYSCMMVFLPNPHPSHLSPLHLLECPLLPLPRLLFPATPLLLTPPTLFLILPVLLLTPSALCLLSVYQNHINECHGSSSKNSDFIYMKTIKSTWPSLCQNLRRLIHHDLSRYQKLIKSCIISLFT